MTTLERTYARRHETELRSDANGIITPVCSCGWEGDSVDGNRTLQVLRAEVEQVGHLADARRQER